MNHWAIPKPSVEELLLGCDSLLIAAEAVTSYSVFPS